jgi:hypothetical protein
MTAATGSWTSPRTANSIQKWRFSSHQPSEFQRVTVRQHPLIGRDQPPLSCVSEAGACRSSPQKRPVHGGRGGGQIFGAGNVYEMCSYRTFRARRFRKSEREWSWKVTAPFEWSPERPVVTFVLQVAAGAHRPSSASEILYRPNQVFVAGMGVTHGARDARVPREALNQAQILGGPVEIGATRVA